MSPHSRIPLSVRIDQEEADFIAALQIDGTATPSEKIRELLKQARLAHEGGRDYAAALNRAELFLQTARHELLRQEKALGVHSHILARLFELLPDLTATLAADFPAENSVAALKKYEREAMWRIVRLFDGILQLAVTAKGAAYDDAVLDELDNTLKLAKIVSEQVLGRSET